MVFSTEGKRDQHIKYSPAHAPPAEGSEPKPAPEPTMDSITIYSGTKLFWRTRLDVELYMQQHEVASAVQVREKNQAIDWRGGRGNRNRQLRSYTRAVRTKGGHVVRGGGCRSRHGLLLNFS